MYSMLIKASQILDEKKVRVSIAIHSNYLEQSMSSELDIRPWNFSLRNISSEDLVTIRGSWPSVSDQ